MKLTLIENRLSICRFVWPALALVGIVLTVILFNFSNEEIKESTVLKGIIVCSFPLLIPMLYCRYRDYFVTKPEVKVNKDALEIVDNGIRIKHRTYGPDKIERVLIRYIGSTTNPSNGIENEIRMKSRFGSKRFYFRLETSNELEILTEQLTDLLGDSRKIDVAKINKN